MAFGLLALVAGLGAVALGTGVRTEDVLAPVGPVPSPRQLAWHTQPYYAFVHFGPNTFTGEEWGSGQEDPRVFNPTALDCRQWARTFRAAGMTGVILTAKHHDGFCLWPSRLSTHTVAQSPWRHGNGDVLRELSDACREEGLRFGVYLSPWDRHHPDYGTERYNDVFVGMLEEVLGGYGPVFEVWFDGANGEGPDGKRQVYDWPRFIATVRRLQPQAVIFSDAGPDVRWVGNEAGIASETNWARLKRDELMPGTDRYRELGEGHADGTHYVPAECDVSIRPGWFWRASETARVKSPAALEDLVMKSIGRGASFLLNVPPNADGLIEPRDARALLGLRRRLDHRFSAPITALARVEGPGNVDALGDDDPNTGWVAPSAGGEVSLTAAWPSPQPVSMIALEEAVQYGQRVTAFRIESLGPEGWTTVARGTTLGVRRWVELPAVPTTAVRIVIERAEGPPILSRWAWYATPATPLP